MPIPIETASPTPNAVFIPQMVIQCGIQNGQLVTSAQIVLAGAVVTNAGTAEETWEAAGPTRSFFVPDVMNLEEDLLALQTDVYTIFGGIIGLVGAMNAIRKVL
jgi:hypothetical protein